MLRYVIILLVLIGLAPIVPSLVEARLNSMDRQDHAEADEEVTSGPRKHRISVDRRGHYVADAYVNGRALDMLVDTGATVTALPKSVARDIGIFLSPSDFKHPIGTANGTVYGARAVIDKLRIGAIRFRNVDAIVLGDESLGVPLLGMSALSQLKRFDISSGTLVLVQ
ncbi:TIGR02281 family clan AA aspartic protease [Roseibium sp. HPY-6]|uniref:retropepsin-like aspartic protease family protein n=1 Tax=Roseibium sp. HPY-6 TaxID=3229852 RepID=UPI00338F1629